MYNLKIFLFNCSVIFSLVFSGCSKLLEVEPPRNQLTTDMVFSDSLSAISALGNIYYLMGNSLNNHYNKNISLYTDEYSYTASNDEFYSGRLTVNNGTNSNLWNSFYEIIYACNDILTRADDAGFLNKGTKNLLINEAKFIRAFCYYHLYVLYENVPIILQTDVEGNRIALQADSTTVFTRILTDLNDAKNGLSEDYQSIDRTRANKWSTSALLAQIYLFQRRWQDALEESDAVIKSGIYSPLTEIDEVFRSNSKETILQLWRLNGFISDATTIIPSSRTALPRYILSDVLYSSFDVDDKRRSNWLAENKVKSNGISKSYWFPYKYKNRSASNSSPEYLKVLRVSEQYLIRAEAKVHLNDTEGAVSDLNMIRTRAGLIELSKLLGKEECLKAIYHERRVELFGEWGKRFIDLKRTSKLNYVMGNYKETWEEGLSERLPIPVSEIIYNKNIKQNEGY
ncbi:putative RagB/SusD domain-containing protein [Sphingobacterium sp. PM2-P1-29]|nr:putative RagB/SusD domain-containing protein [Sphingobacterium sp. PM2-P1-29]